MQCKAKNKAELKVKLDAGCFITNPTPWSDNHLESKTLPVGWNTEVVLDHPARRRFAKITKTAKGWKVE